MTPRSALVLALALLAFAGRTPSAAAAAQPPAFFTNVSVFRSASAFAGVLGPFAEQSAESNIREQTESEFDANGTAHVDTTTNVNAQLNSLTITGDGEADLTATATTNPPALSTCTMTVDFTTTAPMDYSLTGSVSGTNLAGSSNDVASCKFTGNGISIGFGKLNPTDTLVPAGDFSGVLLPGTYELSVVIATSTVSPSVQQQTSFTGLAFSVSTFSPLTPGKYDGLFAASTGTTPSNDTEGVAAVTVKAVKAKTVKGTIVPAHLAFKAKIVVGAFRLAASGIVDSGGRFRGPDGSYGIVLKRTGRADETLALIGDGATKKVAGTMVESGTNATSQFDLDLAVFTSKKNPPAPFVNPPAGLLGSYTLIFPATAPSGQVLTPSIAVGEYPQGTGWATVTVDKNGNATLKGQLADGTRVRCKNALSKDNHWPFYVPLYGKSGSISGSIDFSIVGPCIVTASLRWFRPAGARATVYPAGWPTGLVIDTMGSKFAPSAAGGPIPGIPTTAGAATVRLSDGGLAGSPVSAGATIAANGKVSVVGDNSALKLTVKIDPKTGAVTGSFVNGAANKATKFVGVVVQGESKASGFFLNAPQSGDVEIE